MKSLVTNKSGQGVAGYGKQKLSIQELKTAIILLKYCLAIQTFVIILRNYMVWKIFSCVRKDSMDIIPHSLVHHQRFIFLFLS